MAYTAPRRYNELPVFRVNEVREVGSESQLHGVFPDPVEAPIVSGYLLKQSPEMLESAAVQLVGEVSGDGQAIFTLVEGPADWPVGDARFLPAGQSPVHVWMVSVSTWKWERTIFQAQDAIAVRRPPEAAPSPPGAAGTDLQEPRFWLEIKCLDSRHLSRFYPNRDLPEGLVHGAWDHEHCEFCETHINPGAVAFVDKSLHWLCEACFQTHIRPN